MAALTHAIHSQNSFENPKPASEGGQQWFMSNKSGYPITYPNWTCVKPTTCKGGSTDPYQCAIEEFWIGMGESPVVLGDQTCLAVGGAVFGDFNNSNKSYNVPW